MSDKESKQKLSTEPYKGVRDFYPDDMAVENYIFSVWRKTAESFGYQEYGASVLEPTELYKAKSGQEIINEQTYSFTDRGERDVTLRPEMTPTVARMIAAKRKELRFPIRWYSIPNLFRYEKPQRGRLREFYQFNADIFGLDRMQADMEMVMLAYQIMKSFGLNDKQFEIRINVGVNATKQDAETLMKKLAAVGIKNARFDEEIVRGMEYYTGITFEMYDTGKDNPRALFGGGRYDNLLDIFGEEKVPATGFGMGDVGIKNVLETYNLLPQIPAPADLYLCPMSEKEIEYAEKLAQNIRDAGARVIVDYSGKKVGEQIKYADKSRIPFVAVIGENETKTGTFKIKNLSSGTETEATAKTAASVILQ
ncbi:MAG: histidine--tRNA ligase [Patescibacteria group bacterium]|nr:histidine--tRNA ligase [Patescibacteria group bacterium]MDE1945998.1 histidine--tRNA ligase [Patescibacteria group bacterium]